MDQQVEVPENRFPTDFMWGAATSAYQIEGAYDEDGRGESIWDRFSHTPGKVTNDDTGDIACDHYHRFMEDVELMADLGLMAYRFSIAWPRVLPSGKGRVNQIGLDFYRRLVDGLLEKGIRPYATLYHWDLPQALQEAGGWTKRETTEHFAEYAAVVSKALGDRIHDWVTLNEPWVVAFGGYQLGVHAPGVQDEAEAIQVSHHLLLSHGRAVEALQEFCGEGTQVGIDFNLSPIYPATEKPEDREAAIRYDGHLNRWFLDPIFRGSYPEDLLAWYGDKAPRIEPGDMTCIARGVDFLGVNYYTRIVVGADPNESFLGAVGVAPKEVEFTESGWEIYPQGIYEILVRLQREYQAPALYITENGAAFPDEVDDVGQVNDQQRVQFLQDHVTQAWKAIQEGVNLRGYFIWSLMDLFEWDSGYEMRYGLVHVNRLSLKRTIKHSGLWYKHFIQQQVRTRTCL